MPLDLVKRGGYVIRPTNKVVRAANGTKLELAGEAKVQVFVGDECIPVLAIVSHNVD